MKDNYEGPVKIPTLKVDIEAELVFRDVVIADYGTDPYITDSKDIHLEVEGIQIILSPIQQTTLWNKLYSKIYNTAIDHIEKSRSEGEKDQAVIKFESLLTEKGE